MLPDRRCLVSINPNTNYTQKMGKGYFSRTQTVKDAQKWMCWCNFLHLCFQREKTGMCLANLWRWTLKIGYCKQGNRSHVNPPHCLNVQPFIYVSWEKMSLVLGVKKGLVLKKTRGQIPRKVESGVVLETSLKQVQPISAEAMPSSLWHGASRWGGQKKECYCWTLSIGFVYVERLLFLFLLDKSDLGRWLWAHTEL